MTALVPRVHIYGEAKRWHRESTGLVVVDEVTPLFQVACTQSAMPYCSCPADLVDVVAIDLAFVAQPQMRSDADPAYLAAVARLEIALPFIIATLRAGRPEISDLVGTLVQNEIGRLWTARGASASNAEVDQIDRMLAPPGPLTVTVSCCCERYSAEALIVADGWPLGHGVNECRVG